MPSFKITFFWDKMPPLPEGSWKKCHTQGPLLGAAQGPRAGGPRPEGGSRQGPEGVGIIFHEPKGMGWHFVIINWQAGLLLCFKMNGYRMR